MVLDSSHLASNLSASSSSSAPSSVNSSKVQADTAQASQSAVQSGARSSGRCGVRVCGGMSSARKASMLRQVVQAAVKGGLITHPRNVTRQLLNEFAAVTGPDAEA